ncbi:MAG TPA: hypothetical protein VHV82_03870 [Sporichthyaceae bacterium]|jgi:hypothetical protein|nr:hypothetical protein [Sporichthyaceae bacterium]
MTEPASRGRCVGYRIVLPPGWAQIPLRSGTDEVIEAILDAVIGGLPDTGDLVDQRNWVAARLREAAAAARTNNGTHLYLPVAPAHGRTVAASFVVAEIGFGSVEPLDPDLLVARLAADPNAAQVNVDGYAVSRAETVCPPDPGRGAPLPSHRVDYLMPFPDDPDRWLAVTCSVLQLGDGELDPSATWIELFDAIMSTFRWTKPPG